VPNDLKRSETVVSWQAAMRLALFNGVTQADMTEIIQNVVKKAKAGDIKAADFLFRWTIGQQAAVEVELHQTIVNPPPTQQMVDITDRRPSDPSPEEIKSKSLKMRQEQLEAMRDRKKA
jgi:hypothetical protein